MAQPSGGQSGEALTDKSKEEEDVLGRHIKRMDHETSMEVDLSHGEDSQTAKSRVSYKNSLIGSDSMETDHPNVEELLDEWLKEEENISAEHSAELDKLKKIYPTVEVLGSFKVIISLFSVGVQASVPIVIPWANWLFGFVFPTFQPTISMRLFYGG